MKLPVTHRALNLFSRQRARRSDYNNGVNGNDQESLAGHHIPGLSFSFPPVLGMGSA